MPLQLLLSRLHIRISPTTDCVRRCWPSASQRECAKGGACAHMTCPRTFAQGRSGWGRGHARTGAPSMASAATALCGTPITPPAGVIALRLLPHRIRVANNWLFSLFPSQWPAAKRAFWSSCARAFEHRGRETSADCTRWVALARALIARILSPSTCRLHACGITRNVLLRRLHGTKY